MKQPPKWALKLGVIPSKKGWIHPITGEILIARNDLIKDDVLLKDENDNKPEIKKPRKTKINKRKTN